MKLLNPHKPYVPVTRLFPRCTLTLFEIVSNMNNYYLGSKRGVTIFGQLSSYKNEVASGFFNDI